MDFYASSDPGIESVWADLLKMPESILMATLNITADQVKKLKQVNPGAPFSYDMECAKRCNITDVRTTSVSASCTAVKALAG